LPAQVFFFPAGVFWSGLIRPLATISLPYDATQPMVALVANINYEDYVIPMTTAFA
jgi:hypothetical protein